MSIGEGKNEVRKLQSTGGSTFTVSLPKPWILAQGLAARDSLRVDWRPSGALRITPLDSKEHVLHKAYFSTKNLPENSLHDHLMGAYISGSDEIHIEHRTDDHNMSKDIPHLDFPVCLIWGKQDGVTPPHVAKEFHKLFSRSDLFWIDKCGHSPMWEHPEQFLDILVKWLKKNIKEVNDASQIC